MLVANNVVSALNRRACHQDFSLGPQQRCEVQVPRLAVRNREPLDTFGPHCFGLGARHATSRVFPALALRMRALPPCKGS